MTDPQKDEHIEELLSKLQGIFGKLSSAEEEESKQKLDIPVKPAAPPPTESSRAAPKPPERTQDPTPATSHTPVAPTAPPASPAIPATSGAGMNPSGYESISPTSDPEKMIVPTAVFYPTGKEAEAKSLCMKLEMMTPKFTKVAFRLRVIVFAAYDPKSEWKDSVLKKTNESNCETAFVVVERLLDDTRKKAIAAECESKKLYFQDVPLGSIEKKAYYTDILLGLVFFFDSHKPPTPSENG